MTERNLKPKKIQKIFRFYRVEDHLPWWTQYLKLKNLKRLSTGGNTLPTAMITFKNQTTCPKTQLQVWKEFQLSKAQF